MSSVVQIQYPSLSLFPIPSRLWSLSSDYALSHMFLLECTERARTGLEAEGLCASGHGDGQEASLRQRLPGSQGPSAVGRHSH